VDIQTIGNLSFKFRYKVSQRPYKTALSMEDIKPKWISGGGGSWRYKEQEEGTK